MNKEKLYISAKELYDSDIEKPSWLIENIISKGGITLLIGAPKSSKSWLALNMGVCVAKGNDFLDKFPVKQGKVLYIDEENGSQFMKDRYMRMIKGLEINENLPIDFMIYKDIKLDTDSPKILLENYIKEHRPKLVICDSMVRFMIGDENSATDVRRVFDNLKQLKETYGVAFLLLHHTTKAGNDARGSGDWKGMIDDMFLCKRCLGEHMFEFNQELSRRSNWISNVIYTIEGEEDEPIIFNYVGSTKEEITDEKYDKEVFKK